MTTSSRVKVVGTQPLAILRFYADPVMARKQADMISRALQKAGGYGVVTLEFASQEEADSEAGAK
jgi:hypothetical protein